MSDIMKRLRDKLMTDSVHHKAVCFGIGVAATMYSKELGMVGLFLVLVMCIFKLVEIVKSKS
jgi:hypothetical protein